MIIYLSILLLDEDSSLTPFRYLRTKKHLGHFIKSLILNATSKSGLLYVEQHKYLSLVGPCCKYSRLFFWGGKPLLKKKKKH